MNEWHVYLDLPIMTKKLTKAKKKKNRKKAKNKKSLFIRLTKKNVGVVRIFSIIDQPRTRLSGYWHDWQNATLIICPEFDHSIDLFFFYWLLSLQLKINPLQKRLTYFRQRLLHNNNDLDLPIHIIIITI